MWVVLDTNFLVSCVKKKIDFVAETERLFTRPKIIVLGQVLTELERISTAENKLKDKNAALLALQMIRKFKREKSLVIRKLKAENTDEALLKFDKPNFVIATFDKELKARIKNAAGLRIKNRAFSIL